MATDPHIGTRIRLARERLRWSQQQLADAIGVDVKTVRNWERTGKIRNRQGALEDVLGISLSNEPEPDNGGGGHHDADALREETERLVSEVRRLTAALERRNRRDDTQARREAAG